VGKEKAVAKRRAVSGIILIYFQIQAIPVTLVSRLEHETL
jgi:hypothetical protein